MRHALFFTLTIVVCCSGQMCGGPNVVTDTAADSSMPLPQYQATPPRCERAYRNEVYAFGINPPTGAAGPYSNADNVTKLLYDYWNGSDGRVYGVTVEAIAPYSLADVVQKNRQFASSAGATLIEDRAMSFLSGQVGWVLTMAFPSSGMTTIDVLLVYRGYLYNAAVVSITGATATETQVIAAFLNSLCVDP